MFFLLEWCVAEIKKLKGQLTSIFATLGQLRILIMGVSSGSTPASTGFSTGHGSPEGAVIGDPGQRYVDLDTDFHYTKITGVGTDTGWFVH